MITKKPDSNLSFLYRAVLMLKTEEECERFFDDLCTGPELKAGGRKASEGAERLQQNRRKDRGKHCHHQPGEPFSAVRRQRL